jgi:probable F420-dependent oxidoreductase
MRLGIHLPTFDPLRVGVTSQVLDVAREAERHGFDSIWIGDHLLCPAPVLEATACLAATAAVTERIGLGFSVLLAGLRQPAWTAKQLVTIEQLAPGRRFVLGVGVGGDFPEELAAAEVSPGQRGLRLDETLEVLPALLSGERVGYHGRTLRLDAGPLEPSIAVTPPIYIGGRGEPAIARAARNGDGWLPIFMTPERLRSGVDRLAELAVEHGRPGLKTALLVPVNVDEDLDCARADADSYTRGQYRTPFERFEQVAAVGGAEQVAERIEAYREAGADELILMAITPRPLGQVEQLAGVRDALGYPPAA